jgi:hypothetical protein
VGQIILEFAPAADLHIAKVFKVPKDLADPKLATEVHKRIAEVSTLKKPRQNGMLISPGYQPCNQ